MGLPELWRTQWEGLGNRISRNSCEQVCDIESMHRCNVLTLVCTVCLMSNVAL